MNKSVNVNTLSDSALLSIYGGTSNKIWESVGYAAGFLTSGTMRRAVQKGARHPFGLYYK